MNGPFNENPPPPKNAVKPPAPPGPSSPGYSIEGVSMVTEANGRMRKYWPSPLEETGSVIWGEPLVSHGPDLWTRIADSREVHLLAGIVVGVAIGLFWNGWAMLARALEATLF